MLCVQLKQGAGNSESKQVWYGQDTVILLPVGVVLNYFKSGSGIE